jgi:hypothetical protein
MSLATNVKMSNMEALTAAARIWALLKYLDDRGGFTAGIPSELDYIAIAAQMDGAVVIEPEGCRLTDEGRGWLREMHSTFGNAQGRRSLKVLKLYYAPPSTP